MTTLALLAMSGRKGSSKRPRTKAYRSTTLQLQLEVIAMEPDKFARKRQDSEDYRRGQK